ncbi:MAG: guanylate kinase [Bacteroidia bacterium]
MEQPVTRACIFSAPSGSGKTTIVRKTMERFDCFEFSVSATTRKKRGSEKDGIDYYFLSEQVFKNKIDAKEFLEWEEVYPGRFYGTLHAEISRMLDKESMPIFDVDVQGGVNLKNAFGDGAISFFIQPPSIEVLEERLVKRGTDSPEEIQKRIAKAEHELSFAPHFDYIIINDKLEEALDRVSDIISQHTGLEPASVMS